MLSNPVKIYPRPDHFLYFAEMLPGGDYILFVYDGGSLDLIEVGAANAPTENLDGPGFVYSDVCQFNQMQLVTHRYVASQSSDFGGSIVVELRHHNLELAAIEHNCQ